MIDRSGPVFIRLWFFNSSVAYAQDSDASESNILRIDGRQAAVLQTVFELCDEKTESKLHLLHKDFLPFLLNTFRGNLAWAGVNLHGPPARDALEMWELFDKEVNQLFGKQEVNCLKAGSWSQINRKI